MLPWIGKRFQDSIINNITMASYSKNRTYSRAKKPKKVVKKKTLVKKVTNWFKKILNK